MKFKFLKSLALGWFFLITVLGSSANATLINIDFGVNTLSPSSNGAASGQTGIWNMVNNLGLTSSLLDINGVATPVDLNLTAGRIQGNSGDHTITPLLSDNFFSYGGRSWSFTLTGLSTGLYDIYYYAPLHSSVSTGSFTIDGTSLSSLSGGIGNLVQGISWDVLGGYSVNGSLTFRSISTTSYRGISGLQLVQKTQDVPEPSTIAIFALGMIGLASRRFKKQS
jgi:hypothetical protein